jgi:glycosyltransferase involved in cell wall biosynthesis
LKIALISNYRPDGSYSMLGYARMLEEGLRARGHHAEIIFPPTVFGLLPVGDGELAKWIRYIDKYLIAPIWLRSRIRKADADIVHVCDHSNSIYLRCAGKKPSLITCHDLIAINGARGIYPGVTVRWSGRVQQQWTERGLARARYVICDSCRTQSDFHARFPESAAETRVVYVGLNRSFANASGDSIAAALAALGAPAATQYLLHVGGSGWYKNRLGAMQIFADLTKFPEFAEMKLIMAGRSWTADMHSFRKTAHLEDRVFEAIDVSDSTLNALYSGAQALVFPSIIEGFGWPVLEAQACGCPVITSDRAPMTEVAGVAAIFIDPAQPERAAEVIRQQWHRRAELRELGFRNLERFTLEKMFDGLCAAYQEIAGTQVFDPAVQVNRG